MVSPSCPVWQHPRNALSRGIVDAKRGLLPDRAPGIVQGEGAETAAARTVKKKKCTGFPLSLSTSFY